MAQILVLEDDESMNDVLVRSLVGMGHQPSSAMNVDRALELCLSHTFSLVVTDVILPGQDGMECLAQIKSLQMDVRCIVITGYARKEIPERAIQLKVEDYLLKPFSMQSFLKAVQEVLDTDNERTRRQELLNQLLPSSSVDSSDEVSDMVDRRRDSIRALYVGSRSGFLTRPEAKVAYLGIEAAEQTFRKVLMRRSPDSSRVQQLQVHYAKVYQGIISPQSERSEAGPKHGDIQLTDERFAKLHDDIKASVVGLHDLEYAPLLRQVSDSRLQPFPDLLKLKKHLWPQ